MNDKELVKRLVKEIKEKGKQKIRIMEVCGTHTYAISKYGIRDLLSEYITLLSGPGCPVCVTHEGYIDAAVKLAEEHDAVLVTFGDMLRVKGTEKSLLDLRAEGKRVIAVYSPLDVIEIALENKDRTIVFLGVGFETTAGGIAATVKACEESKIDNVYFLLSLKRMEPILKKVLESEKRGFQAMICPGHVASVVGSRYFEFITEEYNVPAVISGFEALDILSSIYYLMNDIHNGEKKFRNLYKRCVRKEGNILAQRMINEIFKVSHGYLRGIGRIEESELVLKDRLLRYDPLKAFNILIRYEDYHKSCICNEIILGNKLPYECSLFGKICTPEEPFGPCMISSEGSCAIFYKYHRGKNSGE